MRTNNSLKKIYQTIVPGRIYRRSDFVSFSSNIDRNLAILVEEGKLKKIAHGLYMAAKNTAFGPVSPDYNLLIKAFLKDDHFVIYGPSQFNSLELGTTQLYNQLIVFNRKRVGEFTVAGNKFTFYRWREAPKELTPEFLVIELLNRLDHLAENRDTVLLNLSNKISTFNLKKLQFTAAHYGTISTQKKLKAILKNSQEAGLK